MKQNKQQEHHVHEHGINNTNQNLVEIYKTVAQAWHSHFNHAREATSEFDVRRRNFQGTPSRFKLEFEDMIKMKKQNEAQDALWNFNHSLWDPYEIVAVSKRLESGLVLNCDFDDLKNIDENMKVYKRKKESKNSLRKLFNMMSNSRRLKDNVGIFNQTNK
ncbi:unnamed protein product [Amaranthus hypochondriacus]